MEQRTRRITRYTPPSCSLYIGYIRARGCVPERDSTREEISMIRGHLRGATRMLPHGKVRFMVGGDFFFFHGFEGFREFSKCIGRGI